MRFSLLAVCAVGVLADPWSDQDVALQLAGEGDPERLLSGNSSSSGNATVTTAASSSGTTAEPTTAEPTTAAAAVVTTQTVVKEATVTAYSGSAVDKLMICKDVTTLDCGKITAKLLQSIYDQKNDTIANAVNADLGCTGATTCSTKVTVKANGCYSNSGWKCVDPSGGNEVSYQNKANVKMDTDGNLVDSRRLATAQENKALLGFKVVTTVQVDNDASAANTKADSLKSTFSFGETLKNEANTTLATVDDATLEIAFQEVQDTFTNFADVMAQNSSSSFKTEQKTAMSNIVSQVGATPEPTVVQASTTSAPNTNTNTNTGGGSSSAAHEQMSLSWVAILATLALAKLF